jgi:hypothetical protein
MFDASGHSALQILSAVADGNVFTQIVHGLSEHSAERMDIVFALILIGGAIGAGIWIGWEIMKSVAILYRSIRDGITGKTAPKATFQRPARTGSE